MATKETDRCRKVLREEIRSKFQGIPPRKIFKSLLPEGYNFLPFEIFYPFCEVKRIPKSELPLIFAKYNIFTPRVFEEKFIIFLEDEVDFTNRQITLDLSLETKQILSRFSECLRSRRLQSAPPYKQRPGDSICNERPSVAAEWVYARTYNPEGAGPRVIRLSALCKICDEARLRFSLDDFIDSIFEFFGQKIDELTFEQFALLIQTFE